ncbi:MAG: ketoacyl-ACP synthase III [Rhizobiales bacterium]|nr:ketoacyl-ACP synthase III [Hyphomicrobiales bacterium]NRB12810.1 ketoacyl-ACP synthase III [Hyphomicrobiales bacterium]
MSMLRSVITGSGSYLPPNIVTNADLAKTIDTSDEWITARTGIKERRIADKGTLTSDLATKAAQQALENAGIDASEIDLIVLATATPNRVFPSTAITVQANLGITQGCAFDVQAVCSGFLYALTVADNMLRAGNFHKAIVIGAETFSRIIDWQDRTTCVLFADGAGAVILESEQATGTLADRGILYSHLRSDGRYEDMLYVDGGPSMGYPRKGDQGFVKMAGNDVFKHAVKKIGSSIEQALKDNNLTADDIDWFVPHQANKRILDAVAKRIKLDESKVVITVHKHANTSAASIPLALHEAVMDGRIKKGDLILIEALGGGFTWGSMLFRW